MADVHRPILPVANVPTAAQDTLTFRRADGTIRQFVYEDGHTGLRPVYAAAGYYRQSKPMPRNVLRPFRNDNDEPAEGMYFLRETRQSFCRDGRDRSKCARCARPVPSRVRETDSETMASKSISHEEEMAPHRWFMMSPSRVFRDLLMSDVGEPLRPDVRDALLAAFDKSLPAPAPTQTPAKKLPLPSPAPLYSLPSPPPSPPSMALEMVSPPSSTHGSSSSLPPTMFEYFPLLPFEIRRMIWELALPFRVLLRDEIVAPEPYPWHLSRRRGPAGSSSWRRQQQQLSGNGAPAAHSLQELWRSDLFYVCAEARQVVEEFARTRYRDAKKASAGGASSSSLSALLATSMSSDARLRTGLDVPYYPWLGSGAAASAGRPSSRNGVDRAESSRAGSSSNSNATRPSQQRRDGQQLQQPLAYNPDGLSSLQAEEGEAAAAATAASAATAAAAAEFARGHYGQWASYLRALRLPVSTVALDAAWIDKGHADTVAWAAGIDLDDDEEEEEKEQQTSGEEAEEGETASSTPSSPSRELPPPITPSSLQLVVADILVPVRIRLDGAAGIPPAQRALLRQHMAYGARDARENPYHHLLDPYDNAHLNGMDFPVLVDLYDDWRMDELLSLASTTTSSTSSSSSSSVVNKAASHRCIACTRRAWEARARPVNTTAGGGEPCNYWTAKFGAHLGARLQQLCRPTVLFSVVLEFTDSGSD